MEAKTKNGAFTENEIRYLMERRLARLALVSTENEPHVVPVTYEFDGVFFYLSGWNIHYGPRFRDMKADSRVSLLVDDLTKANLWVPRGMEVTGTPEVFEKGENAYMKITPVKKTSWGF